MGLGNDSKRMTFLNISKGRIAVKKDGVVEYWKYVEGWLRDIQIKDAVYQEKKYKQLCLTLDDGTDEFLLQMKFDSGYGRAFCQIVPNVNLKLPIRISPSYTEDGDKKYSKIFIDQDGTPVKWYYKNSDPRDMPAIEDVVFRGEPAKDNSKRMAFFSDLLLNKIRPQLDAAILEPKPSISADEDIEPAISTHGASVADDQEPDDLPF